MAFTRRCATADRAVRELDIVVGAAYSAAERDDVDRSTVARRARARTRTHDGTSAITSAIGRVIADDVVAGAFLMPWGYVMLEYVTYGT